MLITFCINNSSNNQNLRTRQQKRNNAMAFVAVVAIVVVSFNELVLVATGARDTPLLQPPATPPAEAAQFQDPETPAPWPPSHLRLGFVGAYFYYLTLSFAALQLIFACSLCTCVGEEGRLGNGEWHGLHTEKISKIIIGFLKKLNGPYKFIALEQILYLYKDCICICMGFTSVNTIIIQKY